jgi:hypothetical protein
MNTMNTINSSRKETENRDVNLYELLGQLGDHRRGQGRRHELRFVIILVIMSLMSGFDTLRAMGDFIRKNRCSIIEIFKPNKDRLPSHQTVGRALQHVDFGQLSETFRTWALGRVAISDREWISVDGKAVGGTVTNADNKRQQFTGMVSAFVSRTRQSLGSRKTDSRKDSEIPKLEELVNLLGLKGAVITADALHCQVDTTTAIVRSGNDYCIGVKKNQPKLLEAIKKT